MKTTEQLHDRYYWVKRTFEHNWEAAYCEELNGSYTFKLCGVLTPVQALEMHEFKKM